MMLAAAATLLRHIFDFFRLIFFAMPRCFFFITLMPLMLRAALIFAVSLPAALPPF